jgi:hypothetical protein
MSLQSVSSAYFASIGMIFAVLVAPPAVPGPGILVERLGSDAFEDRQNATKLLERLGE